MKRSLFLYSLLSITSQGCAANSSLLEEAEQTIREHPTNQPLIEEALAACKPSPTHTKGDHLLHALLDGLKASRCPIVPVAIVSAILHSDLADPDLTTILEGGQLHEHLSFVGRLTQGNDGFDGQEALAFTRKFIAMQEESRR